MTSISSAGTIAPESSRPDAAALFQVPTTLAPDRSLLTYYALSSLIFGPIFPFALAFFFFRYRTLRYDLDEEGITMRWGVLYRREISLGYTRIQDIHLASNVVERWLGLAKIEVQTASGSAGSEMKIEGLKQSEAIRDFLYSRMRGAQADAHPEAAAALPAGRTEPPGSTLRVLEEMTLTLRDVAAEVRALRTALRPPSGDEGAD